MESTNKKNKFIVLLIVAFFLLIGIVFFVNTSQNKSSFTFQPRATDTAATASFAPATGTLAVDALFTSSVRIAPATPIALQLYKIVVNFNKDKVSVDNINYIVGVASTAHNADTNASKTTINNSGQILLVGLINDVDGQVIPSGIGTGLVQITFKSKVTDPYVITIDSSQSSLVKVKADYSLETVPLSGASLAINGGAGPTATQGPPAPSPTQGGPTATTSPNATATQVPGNDFTLNLKLKFQGVLNKPGGGRDKMMVRVTAVSSGNSQSKTAEFTADNNGIWTGSVTFTGMPIRPNYKVLIKGPKHIQKKVCVATPTETYPGTYGCADGNINIVAGTNNLDFSGIYQLVGDLPNQDGIVNSYDSSLVVNNLYKTDDEAIRLADLNLDGAVNAMDYSLVIAALSVRADEQ